MTKNIFGEKLSPCSYRPLTGFYRDGFCNSGNEDDGLHLVCVVVTDDFLEFSKSKGNDLSTPMSAYNFPGLKANDQWCLCVSRWLEAWKAGKAPKVVLEATHEKALEYVSMDLLIKYAFLTKA